MSASPLLNLMHLLTLFVLLCRPRLLPIGPPKATSSCCSRRRWRRRPKSKPCSLTTHRHRKCAPGGAAPAGLLAEEIEGALKRRRKADKGAANTELMTAQTAAMVGDADVALKAAQTEKTAAEVEAVQAGVEKTRAEVGKVNRYEKGRSATLAGPVSRRGRGQARWRRF